MEAELTQKIIGAAIEVHRYWGPGLLESIYAKSLEHELRLTGVQAQRETPIVLNYKGINVISNFRIDLMVEEKVVLEIKSMSELTPIHEAQLLSYLRITKCRVGLLINFNTLKLKDGIKRLVL